jgi:hypothetical protein
MEIDEASRWTILNSRFETSDLLKQMFDEMFEEWVESLPPDNPARLLYYMLPKPPKPSATRRDCRSVPVSPRHAQTPTHQPYHQ